MHEINADAIQDDDEDYNIEYVFHISKQHAVFTLINFKHLYQRAISKRGTSLSHHCLRNTHNIRHTQVVERQRRTDALIADERCAVSSAVRHIEGQYRGASRWRVFVFFRGSYWMV